MNYTFYGKNGEVVSETDNPYAKIRENTDLNTKSYYVLFMNSRLYNPYHQVNGTKVFKWQSVQKEQFDKYVKYLKTKTMSTFATLERSL